MKSETPAQGILKRNDYGASKCYQIVCECGDSNHDHNVWVEADDYGVTVTVYTTAKTKWWEKNRWKTIWNLLTKGYVEFEADVIMNEQQALNYSEVLRKATKDVKEFREKRQPVPKLGS